MNETTHSDTPADEADVLRAADAWQVKGISVADTVRSQIVADATAPVRSNVLGKSLYETPTATGSASVARLEEAKAEAMARAAAEGIPYLDINRHKPEATALAVVSAEVARAHRLVPIRKVDNKLWVAMENPRDIAAIDAVRMASRCQVIPMATGPEGIISDTLFYAYPQTDTPQEEAASAKDRASENVTAELITLVRDLQNEVRELKQEVQCLKKQVAAQQLAPSPLDARPAAYPAPRVFRATPVAQPPFPLFRD